MVLEVFFLSRFRECVINMDFSRFRGCSMNLLMIQDNKVFGTKRIDLLVTFGLITAEKITMK